MINFKNEFVGCLEKATNLKKEELVRYIEIPPDPGLGSLSFQCFALAKKQGKTAQEVAKETLEKLSSELFEFSEKNGYINARINPEILYRECTTEILEKKDNYGKPAQDKEHYIIDTFNVNTFKTLHIGHLRMIVCGDAIHRMLDFCGHRSIPVYYGGDVGTHVAKWYWYYKKYLTKSQQEVPEKDVAKWFGEIYLRAVATAKEDMDSTAEINDLQRKMLSDKKIKEELRVLRDKSFEAYMAVKDELGVNLEDKIFESETEFRFLEIKDTLIKEHKELIRESEDALIADLSGYGLGVLVLVKQNGSPLYAAKDIALVQLKMERYPEAKNFLYVVGSEQEYYLRQMFKIFSILYPDTSHRHISLGMVNLDTGKMASRQGEMLLYEDFRDALIAKVTETLKDNKLDTEKDTVSAIVFGTIKFEMLKIGFGKTFVFDMSTALDLQGDSAVYVQYSGVRAKSILRNIGVEYNITIEKLALAEEERRLLELMYRFPELVKFATIEYRPNLIAGYCLELARAFNRFYVNCPVISKQQELQVQRVLLVKAYLQCLTNALYLLGINIPERM